MESTGGVGTGQSGRAWALAETVRHALERARLRTLELVSEWPEELLTSQLSPSLSPLLWDLGHIATYEERWLVRALGGGRLMPEEAEAMYDPATHPRHARGRLPLLSLLHVSEYAGTVRRKALELLDAQRFSADCTLSTDSFIYGMVLQHEHRQAETMLATIQASLLPYAGAPTLRPRLISAPSTQMIFHEGGALFVGSANPWAYDNEKPVHRVNVEPFLLDPHPVTNAQFIEFIEDGGYNDARCWTKEGFDFVQAERLQHPLYWVRATNGQYFRTRFGHFEALPLHEPVQHISFHEAQAFARYRGKRLPTEREWEYAAQQASTASANLWHDGLPHAYAPAPVGAAPETATGVGVHQLFGDVWEWCSDTFAPYPGFSPHPDHEYATLRFGSGHRVLRGGSWATHPCAMRASFRNWDLPVQRHSFAGVRCAADV